MTLNQIKALCEQATPGRWELKSGGRICTNLGEDTIPTLIVAVSHWDCAATGEFIAASRALLPKLLRIAEVAKEHFDPENEDECTPVRTRTSVAMREALAALEVG